MLQGIEIPATGRIPDTILLNKLNRSGFPEIWTTRRLTAVAFCTLSICDLVSTNDRVVYLQQYSEYSKHMRVGVGGEMVGLDSLM